MLVGTSQKSLLRIDSVKPFKCGGARLVVIVDDSSTICEVTKYMIEQNKGVACVAFTNPAEALKFILQNDVSLVVTDYIMPDMSGIELTRQIRAHYSRDDLPIIMITAVAGDQSFTAEAVRVGVSDFMNKPLDYKALTARIDAQLAA